VKFRGVGWYEAPNGGVALFSDPRTEDGWETLRVSLWEVDPRPGLAAIMGLRVLTMPMPPRFIRHWPELVSASNALAGAALTKGGPPLHALPESPPAVVKFCDGDSEENGHCHVGRFMLSFVRLATGRDLAAQIDGLADSEHEGSAIADDGGVILIFHRR
jgi:hypothetical protein